MLRSNIIAHRGLWSTNSEKNTLLAFERALECGFGIETDIRDCAGEIVISHDLPGSTSSALYLKNLFELKLFPIVESRLALNIKSCGLASSLSTLLKSVGVNRAHIYTFDMSVPDMPSYSEVNLDIYSRVSDQEISPAFQNLVSGIWLDNFSGNYDQAKVANDLINCGLRITLVSPELHGRDHRNVWDQVLGYGLHERFNFEICTDFPHKAADTFSGT